MLDNIEKYTCVLDEHDYKIIENNVAEKGIENYLSQQLVYLDCSRIINGTRMMQTIGYPYQREISCYLYALHKAGEAGEVSVAEWVNKLIQRHDANLEYEKENPPVWYGGKKTKDKWLKDNNAVKLPRRRNVMQQTIPGMGKELSNAERLRRLSAQFGNLKFNIKPPKKD